MVEAIVYFHRGKVAGVEFQPPGLGKVGTIEAVLPVRIDPAAGADDIPRTAHVIIVLDYITTPPWRQLASGDRAT